MTKQDVLDLETSDYQHRDGNYPKSGIPDTIDVTELDDGNFTVEASFKNTCEGDARDWLTNFVKDHNLKIAKHAISWQDGDYHDDWVIASITVALK